MTRLYRALVTLALPAAVKAVLDAALRVEYVPDFDYRSASSRVA